MAYYAISTLYRIDTFISRQNCHSQSSFFTRTIWWQHIDGEDAEKSLVGETFVWWCFFIIISSYHHTNKYSLTFTILDSSWPWLYIWSWPGDLMTSLLCVTLEVGPPSILVCPLFIFIEHNIAISWLLHPQPHPSCCREAIGGFIKSTRQLSG